MHDEVGARRQPAVTPMAGIARRSRPGRIEIQVDGERLDRLPRAGQPEVVIENVGLALLQEHARERVGDLVADLGALKGRVRGKAAAPAKRGRIREGVAVHLIAVSYT